MPINRAPQEKGKATPLQYSGLENSMDCIVHGVATPWNAAHQASLSITNSQSLPKLMSIESVIPSNHLILCHPLLLLPSIVPRTRPDSPGEPSGLLSMGSHRVPDAGKDRRQKEKRATEDEMVEWNH